MYQSMKPKTTALTFCTQLNISGGSRTAATFKMERSVIIVNDFKPLTVITKRSILDVAAVLDPPLNMKLHQLLKRLSEKF